MRILRIFALSILVCILTIVTQTGGLVLLTSLLIFGPVNRRLKNAWTRATAKFLSFLLVYFIFVFVIVPISAKPFGRVPLPMIERKGVKPGNVLTCLLNRHYVKPRLRDITHSVAADMNEKHPGATVIYLDANFPFLDGFPLFPHLSHNDGKKLDVAFQYNHRKTNQIARAILSFIGYGICEEPKTGEKNAPKYCKDKGYSQYNLLREIVPQDNKDNFIFDNKRTKDLVNSFVSHDGVGKIFIEPHLKARLGLTNNKIRFHGCQAVRHDDHIHVQLK